MTPELVSMAKLVAAEHLLDPALVAAICEQESSWLPTATRFEEGFLHHYVAPLNLPPQESQDRSTSWGLMQIMGQVARELGFTGQFEELLQPMNGLEWGCKHFLHKLKAAGGDVHKALLLWNGGSNHAYPDQVLTRKAKYL